MEAADDIAYCLSDLEDGIEKNILSKNDLQELLTRMEVCNNDSISWFVDFKTKLVTQAVNHVVDEFMENMGKILAGENIKLIEKKSEVGSILDDVKKITISKVYRSPVVEEIELAGYSIILGLLTHYDKLIDLPLNDFQLLVSDDSDGIKEKHLDVHARLYRKLPKSHVASYKRSIEADDGFEYLHRCHLIIDYVSGMTDDYALEIYRTLQGIKVGGN